LVLVGQAQHILDCVLLCISLTFALSSKQQVSSPCNSFFPSLFFSLAVKAVASWDLIVVFFSPFVSSRLRNSIQDVVLYFHYCCGRTDANCISSLSSCSFLWVTVTQMSQAFRYNRAKLSISIQRVMRRVINFCFDNFLWYFFYGVSLSTKNISVSYNIYFPDFDLND